MQPQLFEQRSNERFAYNNYQKIDDATFRDFGADISALAKRGPNARPSGQLSVIYLTNAEAERTGRPYATLEGLDPTWFYNGMECRVDLHPEGFGVVMQLVYDGRADPGDGLLAFIDGTLQLYPQAVRNGKNPVKWVRKDSPEALSANVALYKKGTNYRENDLVRASFGTYPNAKSVVFYCNESGNDIPAPARPEGDAYWTVFNPAPPVTYPFQSVTPDELRQLQAKAKLSANRLYVVGPRLIPNDPEDREYPTVYVRALMETELEPTGWALVGTGDKQLVNYDLETDTTTPAGQEAATSGAPQWVAQQDYKATSLVSDLGIVYLVNFDVVQSMVRPADYPAAFTPIGGTGLFTAARTLYVQGEVSTLTPARGNPYRPFPTLTAAQEAAQPGDTIVVRPGGVGTDALGRACYTEPFTLTKALALVFMPGVIFAGTLAVSTPQCRVMGGEFTARILLYRQLTVASLLVENAHFGGSLGGVQYVSNATGSAPTDFVDTFTLRNCTVVNTARVNGDAFPYDQNGPIRNNGLVGAGPCDIILDNTLVITTNTKCLVFSADTGRIILRGTTELRPGGGRPAAGNAPGGLERPLSQWLVDERNASAPAWPAFMNGITDDTAKTFFATAPANFRTGELEYRRLSTAAWAVVQEPMRAGDVVTIAATGAVEAGQFQLRVRAGSGRAASAIVSNATAITAPSNTIPDGILLNAGFKPDSSGAITSWQNRGGWTYVDGSLQGTNTDYILQYKDVAQADVSANWELRVDAEITGGAVLTIYIENATFSDSGGNFKQLNQSGVFNFDVTLANTRPGVFIKAEVGGQIRPKYIQLIKS